MAIDRHLAQNRMTRTLCMGKENQNLLALSMRLINSDRRYNKMVLIPSICTKLLFHNRLAIGTQLDQNIMKHFWHGRWPQHAPPSCFSRPLHIDVLDISNDSEQKKAQLALEPWPPRRSLIPSILVNAAKLICLIFSWLWVNLFHFEFNEFLFLFVFFKV